MIGFSQRPVAPGWSCLVPHLDRCALRTIRGCSAAAALGPSASTVGGGEG